MNQVEYVWSEIKRKVKSQWAYSLIAPTIFYLSWFDPFPSISPKHFFFFKKKKLGDDKGNLNLLLVCILVHQIFVSVILFKLPKNQTLKKEKGCFLSSLPFIFLHIHLSCFSFPFLQLENFTIGGWKMKTHITRLIKRYKTFSKEMTHLYFEPFDSDQLFVQVFSEIFVL